LSFTNCKALLVLCLIIFSLFFIFNQADYQKEKISNINSNKVTLEKGEKEIVFNKEKYNELVDYINNSDYLQYKRGKLFVTINNIDKFSNIIASDKEIDVDIIFFFFFFFYQMPINESDYIEIVFIDDKIKEISFSTLFDTTINNINFMKEDKSKK